MDAARFLGLHLEPVASVPTSLSAFWQQAIPAWASLLAERGATLST
jgi:hypothetical protein